MNEKLRALALLVPFGCVVFGMLTAWPALFTFLGIALYVALMRELFKHTVPWPWARRLLRLNKIDNPSPPPPEGVAETGEVQVTELGIGAGHIVYPSGHVRRYDA